MITLYDSPRSGHCHRVRLLLSLLDLPFRSVVVTAAERRSDEHLTRNSLGQIPVLEDGGLVLPDSTAILVYLARRYDGSGQWLPADPVGAARVQRWLSIASGELYNGPVLARAMTQFGRPGDLAAARALAARLFTMMEHHLADRDWLAGDHATIADVALYSYIALCDEGGIDLEPHPALRAWLGRVESLPRFVPVVRPDPIES